jgi:hypothetical protein
VLIAVAGPTGERPVGVPHDDGVSIGLWGVYRPLPVEIDDPRDSEQNPAPPDDSPRDIDQAWLDAA